jgi:predicted nuclease of predicted toxin-antitoxin system
MRFLADENFPVPSIQRLRGAWHAVLAIIEHAPGADDSTVLALAVAEDRILLTMDGDFGELIYKAGAAPPPAIVYVRLPQPLTPEEPADLLLQHFASPFLSWQGTFTTVTRRGARQRPLP